MEEHSKEELIIKEALTRAYNDGYQDATNGHKNHSEIWVKAYMYMLRPFVIDKDGKIKIKDK